VGFTMYITCLGVEWAIILESYMGKGDLSIDFMSLLNGNFAVAAVLISFGGCIGKTSPLQMSVMVLVELTCYCANKVYFLKQYAKDPLILDCGGTIIIHVFGAYFGLAVCRVLGPPAKDRLNASNYKSDLFSFIGTVFLWLFWPSFVAGAMTDPEEQSIALINTVLALLASTMTTFALTPMLSKGIIGTVPIQNATLAGGVSIGVTANLVGPFGAMVIGSVAGLLSTWGFIKTPAFADVDTCGIHNLHGMPGLFGGLVSIAVPIFYDNTGVNMINQAIGLVATLAIACATGAGTGFILKMMDTPADPFTDTAFWECAEDIAKVA